MNKILLTLGLFITLCQCSPHKSGEPDIEVQVTNIKKLGSDKFKGQPGTFYSTSIHLLNNTDSSICFWIMSCSWQNNWISDTRGLYLYYKGCDSNYPQITQIGSNQKLTFNGIIQILDTLKTIRKNDFKLGFVLVKKQDVLNMSGFRKVLVDKIKKKNDIIWSNTFKIDK